MSNSTKKLTLIPLILMIFTSVFGFANIPRAFYLMGYGAIPWYIFGALAFFIPYAFMMSEYGAAFKDEKGGIYSWMEKSVNPKYAFIATFMWYSSYIIWMVNTSSSIWIPFSNAIFGKDSTNTWSLFGLNSTQSLGILAVIWMLIVTIVASKGLDKISKITSVGGTAVSLLNIILLVIGLLILALNGGHLAEPLKGGAAFIQSPNPAYGNPIAMLAFLVFAIFAFGGIEAVGGLVEQTEEAEKTFPKGVLVAAVIISVGYAIGIFMFGIFTNWQEVLSSKNIHMGNVAYVAMQNLGYQLGISLKMDQVTALAIGTWMARFVGLSMFLAFCGAFFTLVYSPLKQLIEGTPKELWPSKLIKTENGMPKNAMWIQFSIVAVMILSISFGGQGASEFFSKLVLMTNVAMTIPYMFLSTAFPFFKKKKEIVKPFEIYKTDKAAKTASIIVTAVIGFANLFTIIEPATKGDIQSTIWMIAGPIAFTLLALCVYRRYEKNHLSKIEEKKAA